MLACHLDALALTVAFGVEYRQSLAPLRQMRLGRGQCADRILARWGAMWPLFVKVMPNDYRRMLEAISAAERDGLSGEAAVMAAFESNKREAAKVAVLATQQV